MKKTFIVFIFIFILFPILVSAEVCQKDDIVISKIELNEVRGNAEETDNPNSNNNQININTKMNVIGDSLTYKVVIKNTSNSDYIFDKNQITKDYINYDISYEDNSNIVKSGEEKTIYLRLRYDSKPQVDNLSNGILQGNNQVSFNLINEKGDSLINPETGNKVFFILLIIFIIVLLISMKLNKKVQTLIFIISIMLIPQIVKAVCNCSLDINLNLEIDAKEAVFLPGNEVNIKMKQLAGDDTSTANPTYTYQNESITSIIMSETEPTDINKEEKNIVSTSESPYPIYMWFDNGTIYWWSEDKTPSINSIGYSMFGDIVNLSMIKGVSSFDLTHTVIISNLFRTCNLENLDSLSSWNVSNIPYLSGIFMENANLVSIDGISNWDISRATTIANLFQDCSNLENYDALKKWNTSNITDMSQSFKRTKIKNLQVFKNWDTSKVIYMHGIFDTDIIETTKGLENWDVSNVIQMSNIFARNYYLTDLSSLKNWNTSKVQDIGQGFLSCTSLEDLTPLKDWDVSNITDMYSLFNNNKKLTDLTPLKNWNVSKVNRLFRTFRDCISLQELTGLENWDVSNVEDFSQLFYKNTELVDISAITNWDTTSGTNMSSMFYSDTKISNVSYINDWNIQNVTSFSHMFRYLSIHPEFTKVSGTWSNGTFTPTE